MQGFDLIELGILATDAFGRVLHANKQAEAVTKPPARITIRSGLLAASDVALDQEIKAAISSTSKLRVGKSLNVPSVARG